MDFSKFLMVLLFVLVSSFFEEVKSNSNSSCSNPFEGYCQIYLSNTNIPPEWNDFRINSYQGRIEIIEEAYRSAILKLIDCSSTRIGLMLGPNGTKPQPSKNESSGLYFAPAKNTDEIFRFGKFMWQFIYIDDGLDGFCIETLLRVEYSQILKDLDYARLEKKRSYSSEERISENSNRVYGKHEHERFEFTLEIFPPLFENEEYLIPGFGWAKSPVEAVEFIVLHELGHAEIYAQSARIKFLKNFSGQFLTREDTDEEAWADSFAASILSCFSER